MLARVPGRSRPQLSHAVVDVDSGGWLAAEELPAAAKAAAARLRQLPADPRRGASWLQRARASSFVTYRLDQTKLWWPGTPESGKGHP